MQPTLLSSPVFQSVLSRIGRLGLFIFGWRTKGRVPDLKKFILVCAPHTSNWDFVFFLLMVFKFRMAACWMGKDTLFIPPFRSLLKRLGGIPIDRSKSLNTVSQMAKEFDRNDRLVIAIAPSGTRRCGASWKTGFYHIAKQANVPIVCGYVDYKTRTGGLGPVFIPQGDIAQDMKQIQSFYRDKSGR